MELNIKRIYGKHKKSFYFLLVTLTFPSITTFGQLKIKLLTLKRETGQSRFAFPIVISPNKEVAKKINNYLQTEILENTLEEVGKERIFEKTKFIQNDEISQSGHTSIEYEVGVNTHQVFSLQFDMEGMGAFPINYHRYYNFNIKTGEIILAKNLFTAQGLTWITKVIIIDRKKRIDNWIRELDTIYEKSEDYDSIFIREKFVECNKNSDEDNFFIKKNTILFYKEDCFPHAWQAFETNLNIEIGFKEIEHYLSESGKKLLYNRRQEKK